MRKITVLFMLALLLPLTVIKASFTDSTVYYFNDVDSTIFKNQQSDNGSLKLANIGSSYYHSGSYGIAFKVGSEIKIAVNGNSTVRFLGSAYSATNMSGVSQSGGIDLGEQYTKVSADLVETYDFVYEGDADTLIFTVTDGPSSGQLYLPQVEVVPEQDGGNSDLSEAVKNIIYYFDLRDGSIIPDETSLNGDYTIDSGLFKIESGSSNAYGYNGSQHGAVLNTGNVITLQVAGNSYIKLGGCQYSGGSVTLTSTAGDFEEATKNTQTAANYSTDGSTVDFLYVGDAGEVILTFTGTTYIPIIYIVPTPYDIELNSWAEKSGKIIIDNDTISLTSGATAEDNAVVEVTNGSVLSATSALGYLRMDLGGDTLKNFTPEILGDISEAIVSNDTLYIAFADSSAIPFGYVMKVVDLTEPYVYDFTDGEIISTNGGQSYDGSLKLDGSYGYHSYGLNMKAGGEIKVAVDGSSTLRFLGSTYNGLNMTGVSKAGGVDLGEQSTTVTIDRGETFDFVYEGGSDTLIFTTSTGTGNDIYLPEIEVVPEQAGGNKVLTEAEKNVIYYFDLRDGSIIPDNTELNGNYTIDSGLFKIECGASNAYGYNGAQHGAVINEGNMITLQVAGNSYIKLGGCQYSNGSVTLTSTTGEFETATKNTQTAANYSADGSTVDFLYVGDAGEVTLTFAGTTYIPIIYIVPTPYDIELTAWAEKSGTITINGVDIYVAAGPSSSDADTVEVSDGTVISATSEAASIRIDLAGSTLDSYTPTLEGDISQVTISNDTMYIAWADSSAIPYGYIVAVADNSQVVEAQPGTTYTYSFYDGTVLPQTSYSTLRYSTFVTEDGIVTINSNTDDESLQFGFHDATHGAVMFPGNSFDFVVAGDAVVTFGTCQYGSVTDGEFVFTDSEGTELGSCASHNIGTGACGTNSFSYSGNAGVITATLTSESGATGEVYIHGVTIENAALIPESDGKIDVWDFGAEQLDTSIYRNWLGVDTINAWYDESIEVGSAGNVLPSFSSGVLSWIGGGNDRLRTTNTSLTRYDAQSSSSTYAGRVYVNATAATGRYMSLALSEDDEVTIIALSQNGSGIMNFEYVADPDAQTDQVSLSTGAATFNFVAKAAGTYHIFDDQDKPSYFRIYRKDANYATVSGTIDTTAAENIPTDFNILFENEAGKVWEATLSESGYSVTLPAGYTYSLSLANANGYVFSSANSFEVFSTTTDTANNAVLEAVELFEVTGSITGLGDELANAAITYTADPDANKIYEPEITIDVDAATYSVQLEPNCEYTISAEGVNDYYIPDSTITITGATTDEAIAFTTKPVYEISITATGLDEEQLAKLELTFTNLFEDGYAYTFESVDDIDLREGVYTIAYDGLDSFAVDLDATSNLTVDGAATSKELVFSAVTNWSFDDKDITGSAYKGLLFTGSIGNESAKGHLTGKDGATIQIPVEAGDILRITYYYTADFTIEGSDNYTTSSQSTTTYEYADYSYTGTEAGYVTITIGSSASTTYITNIEIGGSVEYASVITVGEDKDYQTINGALDAIAKMDRTSDQRVTVMIDPGNYEEMLVIDVSNVTFTNAAETPSIALLNKGVDINDNAVRITSYYGHGYNYYSMDDNVKWDEDVLRVNKENGYLSYENPGSGTTDGSYWNATVVISADGFEANYIIFENSFNQYISQKESEDVVEEWESGGKGTRPTDYGNTDVQDKDYVERAAAISIAGGDQIILNKCRVVGRQDSFYGAEGSRIAIYKGSMMGAVDYIFGGMTAVFYQSDLVMNTSDASSDVCYITAAYQQSSRGYLMYECTVTSSEPETESASTYKSKPGYFGRPWLATTSEVVFFNTTVETTNYSGYDGQSLINAEGWLSSLGGESELMYEYGTIEESGVDNSSSRASWSTVLTAAELTDGTEITAFNFTKGSDDWDPIPALVENDTFEIDPVSIDESFTMEELDVKVYSYNSSVFITNVTAETLVNVYSLNGVSVKSVEIYGDTEFTMRNGLYVVNVLSQQKQRTVKVLIK